LGNLRERDTFEDAGVSGRIILKWICKRWDGGVDWIDLAQGRDRRRALMSTVINLRVP
jgi:hypothetical protein